MRVDAGAQPLTAAGIKIASSGETVFQSESREPIAFTAFAGADD